MKWSLRPWGTTGGVIVNTGTISCKALGTRLKNLDWPRKPAVQSRARCWKTRDQPALMRTRATATELHPGTPTSSRRPCPDISRLVPRQPDPVGASVHTMQCGGGNHCRKL